MKTFKQNEELVFNTIDSTLLKHSGKKIVIETVYDKPDIHRDAEVLPMYKVRLKDENVLLEAFHDELTPSN